MLNFVKDLNMSWSNKTNASQLNIDYLTVFDCIINGCIITNYLFIINGSNPSKKCPMRQFLFN